MNSNWLALRDIYKALRLQPLDTFIQNQYRQKFFDNSVSPKRLFRGLGATTWMCLRGIVDIQQGINVTFIFETQSQRDAAITFIKRTMQLLGCSNSITLPDGNSIRWPKALSTFLVQTNLPDNLSDYSLYGVLYDDADWAKRTERRAQGPLTMVRTIQLEKECYRAYAEEQEYLFDLDKKTALALWSLDKTIKCIPPVL